jgi:hypothetical protein
MRMWPVTTDGSRGDTGPGRVPAAIAVGSPCDGYTGAAAQPRTREPREDFAAGGNRYCRVSSKRAQIIRDLHNVSRSG